MEPQATQPAAPSDPFAQYTQPAAPAPEPTPAPAPEAPAPTEPQPFVPYQGDPNVVDEAPAPTEAAPTEVATPQPEVTPPAPEPTPQPQPEQYQTYEEYMNSILGNVPEAAPAPKLDDINQEDPEAIRGFFDDLVKSAVTQAEANVERRYAIKEAESTAWNQAFETYPSLRENGQLRSTIHAIRMDNFRKGIAMTPTQAAQHLLSSMNSEYQRGITDNQVHTKIENVQPTNGSSVEVPQANSHVDNLLAIQQGGETALAAILDAEVRAGRL